MVNKTKLDSGPLACRTQCFLSFFGGDVGLGKILNFKNSNRKNREVAETLELKDRVVDDACFLIACC